MLPHPLLAYLVILAKAAGKMAMGKKNSPRAFGAANCGFFPKMRQSFGNLQPGGRLAPPFFSFGAVYQTFPGTKRTGGKYLLEQLCPFTKFPCL
jgi:hypothetical protein